MKTHLLTSLFLASGMAAMAQPVSIIIDANADNMPISPYLYGRNGATSDKENPTSPAEIQRMREAGLRFARMNNGNNATKYNWRRHLASHPDWYNNVYYCNWDQSAADLQAELPGVQGQYAFQLIGKAAKTNEFNFNDWAYNQSAWGEWCALDVCGGGELDASGKLVKKGDASLYLEDWTADSTVGIYTHWRDNLGLDMSQFRYWSMDNEFEMYPWTHSDVVEENTDEVYEMIMQNYFATAKAIRAIDPAVKLCGPMAGSEWTWYSPADKQPVYKGKQYCWLEYFIMRCAEEEKATGVNMLDVLDIHFYPNETDQAEVLQTHRVLYDTEFDYPKANGVKTVNAGWDNNQTKEYIFVRCQQWIDKYFGPNRGITFAISEYDNQKDFGATVTALCHASFIGEGARHGMEYFTPWTWQTGMWESLHLFGRYAHELNAQAVSTDENLVSAYTSITATRDSMAIILVNRDGVERPVSMSIGNFNVKDGEHNTYLLANLPKDETFNSHEDNALVAGTVKVENGALSVTVPAYSMLAVDLAGESSGTDNFAAEAVAVYPNPTTDVLFVTNPGDVKRVEVVNAAGQVVKQVVVNGSADVAVNVTDLAKAVYVVKIYKASGVKVSTVVVE